MSHPPTHMYIVRLCCANYRGDSYSRFYQQNVECTKHMCANYVVAAIRDIINSSSGYAWLLLPLVKSLSSLRRPRVNISSIVIVLFKVILSVIVTCTILKLFLCIFFRELEV